MKRLATLTAMALMLGPSAHAQGASERLGLFAAPVDGGARRLQGKDGGEIALFANRSANSEMRTVLEEGAILANMGCSAVDGIPWCKVISVQTGAEGYVLGALLAPVIGPDGTVATGIDDSRQRATRKIFDATSEAPCAQEQGQALGTCQIGVARSGGGDATIAATFPNGFSRLLFFVHGEFLRANPTMSGVGTDTDWQVSGGLHLIRADDQRFEIPVAFVLGE